MAERGWCEWWGHARALYHRESREVNPGVTETLSTYICWRCGRIERLRTTAYG